MRQSSKGVVMGRAAKSRKNILYGLLFQVLYLLFTFVKRVVMLKTAGIEAVSINQLLAEVIAVMAIADLGIQQAITFHLYKPLAEENKEKVASIMRLFKFSFYAIGGVIFLIGMIFLPFSTHLLKGIEVDKGYFYTAYILVLLKVAIPYMFGFLTALLNADQKSHMYMKVNIRMMCVMTVIEIIVLFLTHSLIWYLVLDMAYNILTNVRAAMIARKEYPYLADAKPLPGVEIRSIFVSIRRTFISKVSNKVLNSTDNILISTIVSTVMVGIYSQYSMFINGFLGLFAQINTAITGSVGNIIATETNEYVIKTYKNITYFFFAAALFVSACFYVGVGPFLVGIIGREYTINWMVLTLVTANLFLEIIKMPLWTFFYASGFFMFDQIVSLIACIVNIAVSIILGRKIGMSGIFLGTMVSLVFMMITKILYFYKSASFKAEGLLSYLLYSGLFVLTISAGRFTAEFFSFLPVAAQFFVNVIIMAVVSLLMAIVPFLFSERLKYWIGRLKGVIQRRFKHA